MTKKTERKSIYDLFSCDTEMEKKGIWQDFGIYGKFLIARSGGANARYVTMLSKAMEPYQRQLQKDMMDNDVAESILRKIFAKTVVLDWSGVIGRDGKEIKYSYDNCIKLLTDLPEFFQDMREESARIQNFRKSDLEEDSKN